jgi:BirA family transcriptional regulator, biotin operon repressor / biotin---[acetyl-CoA-carboxylase] ligase
MSWNAKLFGLHLATRRFGRESVWFEDLDSTNLWLAAHSAEFTMSGAVVVADHQTHGKGRRDRGWHDMPGASMLCSVLLRHPAEPAVLGWLSMTPAIALGDVLHQRFGAQLRVALKWPNDVQLNGRKLAGILGQSTMLGTQSVSVVGVGINVGTRREDIPAEFRERSTSLLAETGELLEREVLLAEMLNSWESVFDLLQERRFDELERRWRAFGPATGEPITRLEDGKALQGVFAGLGAHGQLLLRDDQGTLHELFTGDLS